MNDTAIQALLDKQAITEVLWKYSHALDRHDIPQLHTVYWPDAIDDHGAYSGSGAGFCEFLGEAMAPGSPFKQTHHMISNILIDLAGDRADVESYYQSYHRLEDDSGVYDETVGGRYIDLFERRQGEWRILHRRCLYDWARREPGTARFWDQWPGVFLLGTRDRSDPSFQPAGVPAPQSA